MQISIEWFGQQFNVALATSGEEPFLVIKGCRIVDGRKGAFISWPATKRDNGKYWNHVYANAAFAAAVLEKAQQSTSKAKQVTVPDDAGIPF